jgi:hypothetical protein
MIHTRQAMPLNGEIKVYLQRNLGTEVAHDTTPSLPQLYP